MKILKKLFLLYIINRAQKISTSNRVKYCRIDRTQIKFFTFKVVPTFGP